ncbi:MAG: 4Fe-4S ferredoxin, iron-sulpur binding protein [Firmicutes bacterium]|nr:4Fe-4S ferredoxin, iron-sulpur binding protein [Bacillota bacterium]
MNDFVVADPGRCIGCRTCEIACALAHSKDGALSSLTAESFVARLKVVKTARVTTPIQCRHCENAPCVKACTKAALVQSGDSVQVVEGVCIGCKECVMACPYGAIELCADNDDAKTVKVIKCDLCKTSDGSPACVKVCPTKAINEIHGYDLIEEIKNKRIRAALG